MMNTVGKPGKLGEHVRCVVSVSMLTEGWDANTVTHILGVRAFGTQLLCEQVVGRGLRRMQLRRRTTTGMFEPEYAEVYGVRSRFIPTGRHGRRPEAAEADPPGPGAARTAPRCEITFPRVDRLPLRAADRAARRRRSPTTRTLVLSTAGRADRDRGRRRSSGESSVHDLDDLEGARDAGGRLRARQARCSTATSATTTATSGRGSSRSSSRSPERWLDECVTLQGRRLPAAAAAQRSSRTRPPRRSTRPIVAAPTGEKRLHADPPPVRPDRLDRATSTSTRRRPSTTTDPTSATSTTSSQDSDWEANAGAARSSRCPRSSAYVKNQGLGFTIPYTLEGRQRATTSPTSSSASTTDERRAAEPDHRGLWARRKKDKAAKVATARDLWVPGGQQRTAASGAGRSSRSPTRGTPTNLDPRPSSRASPRSAACREVSDGAQEEAPTGRRRSRRSRTRGHADEHPDRRAARRSSRTTRSSRRRCSTRATRRSTRSSCGRARTSRTRDDLEVPAVPIYIQEKIDPRALIEDLRAHGSEPDGRAAARRCSTTFDGLDVRGPRRLLPARRQLVEPHDPRRLAAGDGVSLAEKEGLKGKVQMIYIDPPYGIKFGSNWQVSTRKRDVKDGKVEDVTRQPEQIKAFRDTWELGIHSYLAYLRDRLVVARDLLTEIGLGLRPDRRRERAPRAGAAGRGVRVARTSSPRSRSRRQRRDSGAA